MDVSIIMINYNTYDFTKNAINSLLEQTKDIEYEIILIDNLSPDKSGDKLALLFKDKIKYIQANSNLGTSKAVNLGIKNSLGKYILWLNTDILVKENFVYKLYKFMNENKQCGICGGNLLDFEGRPASSIAFRFNNAKTARQDLSITRHIISKFRKRCYDCYNYKNKPIEVAYTSGADFMIRREVIDLIGGLNEKIFMYAEESEYAFRMKRDTNFISMSYPDAKMYHYDGGSFKNTFSAFRTKVATEGYIQYLLSCYDENEVEKFFKYKLRGYKKILRICKIFKKSKIFEYESKLKIMNEIIEEYRREKQ